MRPRRSARIYVFDPAGRVLLIRFVIPRQDGDFVFWLTPGGEIEPGESELHAAVRELREELGLEAEVTGPVYTETNQFLHQGEMRDNLDFFFTAACAADAPKLIGVTPEEIAVMKEIRWWTADEVEQSADRFFPIDLAARVTEFRPYPQSHDTIELLVESKNRGMNSRGF